MDVNPLLNFVTKDDEIQYWMEVAHQMHQRKEDAERELQEYQEHSQLLERELETSFEQSDRRNRELRQINYKLCVDNEDLKNRLNEQIQMYDTTQSEVEDLRICNDELLKCITKLEQKNDDLERFNREKAVSEEELETQFNMTLEKLAFLETEVDEVESLKVIAQRLQEENKDLRQQIEADVQKKISYINECAGNENLKPIYHEPQNERKSRVTSVIVDERSEHARNAMPHDVLNYVREFEQKIDCPQKAHSASKMSEEKLKTKLNLAIKKVTSLEKELREKENFTTNTLQRWKDESRDWSQEIELRLRRHNEKNEERTSRPRSGSNKHQEENLRNFSSNRLSRHIENRVKKVKEEEKRQQNLVWFLKRWRYMQLNWLRKKE